MSATPASGGRKGYENRTQEVSAISRGLKGLSKELDVPVLALSQLSRASERRGDDKRPMRSDLRESGSIEQDADVVAFIHRDSYYNRSEEMSAEERAKSEIILAKQRNGPTGTIHLNFISRFTRFDNPDSGHEVWFYSSFKTRIMRPAISSLGDSPGSISISSRAEAILYGRSTSRLDRKSAPRKVKRYPRRMA